jgi:RNA polymerase sigma-70 factor (ECF subfamily)
VNAITSFRQDIPDTLIARMRDGDLEAFEQVYRRFERPAFTLALRLTGQRESAQEVLQDGMLKAFERIDQFRGEAPFWGWLRQLVVNEALMHVRRRNRFDHTPVDDNSLADPTPAPWRHADAQALERALAELPDTARAVLWLYHVEGYTHVEIAAQFGRSESFSKSQLARGTRRLRELLAPEVGATPSLLNATGNAR